jgi:branched-chain amino acid aminotransferase
MTDLSRILSGTLKQMHEFLLHNGQILDSRDICLTPGQVGLLAGWGVFSTIRVYEGVLFAYERHWARLRRDATLFRVPMPPDADALQEQLLALVQANKAYDATLRVCLVRNRGGLWEGPGVTRDGDVIAFTTNVKEWGSGVRLGLMPNARYAASPFAGTKVLSWCDNLTWYEVAHERGLDEMLLLNERGEVAECTSANIFAEFGNRVLTPPLSSGCLPGITRDVILHDCRTPGYTVEEGVLTPTDLEGADELFITSTTRELLPVREIEDVTVKTGGGARRVLQAAFSAYVDDYVARRRAVSA